MGGITLERFDDYQSMSERTIPSEHGVKKLLTNFALGLTGEAGEVADIVKKHVFHGHDLDLDDLKKELGDVLFYLTGLCTVLAVDLKEVAEGNYQKLLKRYPNGFNQSDSINREE
jgi:NTP pyrophosphatase (non-canonical NTP hydrolase)